MHYYYYYFFVSVLRKPTWSQVCLSLQVQERENLSLGNYIYFFDVTHHLVNFSTVYRHKSKRGGLYLEILREGAMIKSLLDRSKPTNYSPRTYTCRNPTLEKYPQSYGNTRTNRDKLRPRHAICPMPAMIPSEVSSLTGFTAIKHAKAISKLHQWFGYIVPAPLCANQNTTAHAAANIPGE